MTKEDVQRIAQSTECDMIYFLKAGEPEEEDEEEIKEEIEEETEEEAEDHGA